MLCALEIVAEALNGVGVDPPDSLTSGGDLGKRTLGIANAVGQSLATRYEWQILRTEGTFTTVAQEEQFTIATEFPNLRKWVDETLWNRTTQRKIFHVGQRTWARIKSDGVSPATEIYILSGGKLRFPSDTAVAGQTVAFEYIDNRWAETSDSATKLRRFAGDTNIPRLDDHMFVLGVRWRYLQSLGMEYGEHFREYEDYVQQKIAEDRPRETLSLNPHMRSEGYDTQIPDGNWNQ